MCVCVYVHYMCICDVTKPHCYGADKGERFILEQTCNRTEIDKYLSIAAHLCLCVIQCVCACTYVCTYSTCAVVSVCTRV